jgi:conjugative transfer signal peptidase TraF
MGRASKLTLTVGSCLAAFAITAWLAGIRINTTGSYPMGVYQMVDAPIEKGSLVIFCPADNPIFRLAKQRSYIPTGFCPGGYGYLIKKISGIEGDHVKFSAQGVTVNGKLLPNSAPMDEDLNGQNLTHIEIDMVLDDHSTLLMSDYSPKSFDARYFGLTDKSHIISVVRPLWMW